MNMSPQTTWPGSTEVDQLRAEVARLERNIGLLREVALVSRGGVDLTDTFQAIYERLEGILHIDAFFVAMCDRPDSREYHFALFVDEGQRFEAPDRRVGGLAGWILDLKQPRLFRDLHAERDASVPMPEQFGSTRRSRSWMGVPMMIGRESVGVISVQSYEPNVYDERDLQLVELLADLAAVAIENALLYRTQDELSQSLALRVAARSEELAVLTAIASGLSRGQYNEELLTEAIERILWLLNFHAGAVWLDEPRTGLRRVASIAGDGRAGQREDTDEADPDPFTLRAIEERRPIMQPAVRSYESGSGRYAFATLDEDESVFAVPLQAHGRVAGALTLYGKAGRELDAHELSLLEAASRQIGIGVESARLYRDARATAEIAQQRAHNLALVHIISRLVSSSLDPGQVVQVTAEQMVQLFGVDHCAIMLFDSLGTYGQVVAEYPPLGTVGTRGNFVPGDFLETEPGRGEPQFVTDIANDRRVRSIRASAVRLGVQALLLVPLISRGQSIGTISLNMIHKTRTFADEEREICRTIAAQVAIALENARLYQVAITRVEQEMEIARSIQANLFPQSLPGIPSASLAGRCLPALETGGDFYDVIPLGGERFGFSIGDVSGKSLPAAMLMAVARSIVRSEAIDHGQPEQVVTEANRLVVQDVPPNTFVALCYAVYEADTRTLVLANAGQITPFMRHADGRVEWLPVISNLPVGLVPDLEYSSTNVGLAPGDSVLFLTDGLVEAFSADGSMFGFDRLAEIFGRHGHLPADEVVSKLLDTVCEWQGNENRHDDMTAIVLQVR